MTRKSLSLLAAVSMMAGGAMTLRAQQTVDTTTGAQVQQQTTDQQQTTGAAAAGQQQSPHADDIRRVLARVTEDGIKGKTNDIADNFTNNAQDQFKRAGVAANQTGPGAQAQTEEQRKEEMKALDDQLRDTSRQFADAWKAKYNHDFSIDRKAEAMVYSGDMFQILKGDVSNVAQPRTAGEREGAAAGTSTEKNTDKNAVERAAERVDRAVDRAADKVAGRTAADNENRMATVMVPESHGLPAVSLLMVNEGTFGNRWHIQPPPGQDYRSLSMSLNKHLQDLLAAKDQWPADENEASRMVSHHILAAIATGQRESAQPAGFRSGEQQQQQPIQQQPIQPQRQE